MDRANNTRGGKSDHFPLDVHHQLAEADDLELEEPQLLDPIDPDDWKLLTFLPDGYPTPTKPAGTPEHQRAATSIDVYHLHCKPLVNGRAAVAGAIHRIVQDLERLRPQDRRSKNARPLQEPTNRIAPGDPPRFRILSGRIGLCKSGNLQIRTRPSDHARLAERDIELTQVTKNHKTSASALVQRVWNYAHVLKDDGLAFMDYTEQITYLLFLKMAWEQRHAGASEIPSRYSWGTLQKIADKLKLLERYHQGLRKLSERPGLTGLIFTKPQSKITDPAKLRLLIQMIDGENWSALDQDVKGEVYEGLLAKMQMMSVEGPVNISPLDR